MPEGTQQIWQDVDPDSRVTGEPEAAPMQSAQLVESRSGGLELCEDPLRMLVQQFAGLGELNAAADDLDTGMPMAGVSALIWWEMAG